MTTRSLLIAILAILVAVGKAAAQEPTSSDVQEGTGLEMSEGRLPVAVTDSPGEYASALGLTREAVQERAFATLRRLGFDPYDWNVEGDGLEPNFFSVSVAIYRGAYFAEIAVGRPVWYEVEDQTYWTVANAWEKTMFGEHHDDAQHVLTQLDNILNSFADQFRLVNR